jgi:hypothetical protein
MAPTATKRAYTVTCSSALRGAVLDAAARRGGNAADVARAGLFCLTPDLLAAVGDPGDAPGDDRDAAGRKPRLQMRLPAGLDAPTIRTALALAVMIDTGDAAVTTPADGPDEGLNDGPDADEPDAAAEEISRLRATVAALSFDPVAGGVRTRDEALFVLGLPPGRVPGRAVVEARFRLLATIHHPDQPTGSHTRMTQVNEAAALLRALLA